MMISAISSAVFMLAQNSEEKSLTILGLALFAALMLFLIIDSLAKNKYIPKKGPIRGFLIFLLIVAVIVVNLLIIFYK